jgi:hypothetical protein
MIMQTRSSQLLQCLSLHLALARPLVACYQLARSSKTNAPTTTGSFSITGSFSTKLALLDVSHQFCIVSAIVAYCTVAQSRRPQCNIHDNCDKQLPHLLASNTPTDRSIYHSGQAMRCNYHHVAPNAITDERSRCRYEANSVSFLNNLALAKKNLKVKG